jgi:hypothetical protein
MDLILFRRSDWGEAVDLVEENDRGLARACLVEQEPELTFSLTNPFRQAVGTFAHKKGCRMCEQQGESGEPRTKKNEADVQMLLPSDLEVAANARATSVLPVPGGPWKRTPRGGVMLNCWKISGYRSGSWIISLSELMSTRGEMNLS